MYSSVVERRSDGRKVTGSMPGRSGGEDSSPESTFWSDSFGYPLHPRVTTGSSQYLSRQNTFFVETNITLSRQKFCRGKHTFVATKMILVAAPANDTRRRPRSLCQKRGNTHTLLAQRIRSACGDDCRLYRHDIVWEPIRETNSHANRPGTLVYSYLSSLSLCGLIVGQKDRNCYS